MRPLEEVQAEVFDAVSLLDTEPLPLGSAVGRVLAVDVVASEDVPPFSNSAMDGFAVRSQDVAEPGVVLRLVDDVPAGRVAKVALGEGEAIKIMTGAPMPDGADAILRVEDSEEEDGKVRASVAVDPGTSVRPAGGDVSAGDIVFQRGTRLTPAHVGVLATLGETSPAVYRRPIVGLMSTGDELQPPETKPLGPGMIRDSNRPVLRAMLSEVADLIDLGRVPDDADALRSVIGRAAVEADAIVSSGGVSMGEHDVTKMVLKGETSVRFMQVAIKPAKPFGFGLLGRTPFFGLPGNPVSAMISFEQFVRPALLIMQGASAVLRPRTRGVAGERFETDSRKTVFARVKVADPETMRVIPSGGQESNVLSATANADALAVIPRGVGVVAEGAPVLVELFKSAESRSRSDVG